MYTYIINYPWLLSYKNTTVHSTKQAQKKTFTVLINSPNVSRMQPSLFIKDLLCLCFIFQVAHKHLPASKQNLSIPIGTWTEEHRSHCVGKGEGVREGGRKREYKGVDHSHTHLGCQSSILPHPSLYQQIPSCGGLKSHVTAHHTHTLTHTHIPPPPPPPNTHPPGTDRRETQSEDPCIQTCRTTRRWECQNRGKSPTLSEQWEQLLSPVGMWGCDDVKMWGCS